MIQSHLWHLKVLNCLALVELSHQHTRFLGPDPDEFPNEETR